MQLKFRHRVGRRKGPVGAVLVANLPVEHHVVVLVLLVIAYDWRSVCRRLSWVYDDRQSLIVDDDRLARVLGDVGVVGYDARDFLSLESHLVGR